MVKYRGSGDPKTYTTTDSFAYTYLEDRRVPKYVPIKVKYPLISDRRAANIDYTDPSWHRSFGGEIPLENIDYSSLTIVPPKDFSAAEFQYVSDANNGSNVPEGFMGTSSGIVPIIDPPFTSGGQHGEVQGNPAQVDAGFENDLEGGADFYYASNIETQAMKDKVDVVPQYYPLNPENPDSRFRWQINSDYQAPTEPQVRYPRGAQLRKPKLFGLK